MPSRKGNKILHRKSPQKLLVGSPRKKKSKAKPTNGERSKKKKKSPHRRIKKSSSLPLKRSKSKSRTPEGNRFHRRKTDFIEYHSRRRRHK